LRKAEHLSPFGCSFSWRWAATLPISQYPPLQCYQPAAAQRFALMCIWCPKPPRGCSPSQQDNVHHEEEMLQLEKAETREQGNNPKRLGTHTQTPQIPTVL